MNELEPIKYLDSAVAEVFDLMLGTTCRPVQASVEFAPSLTVTLRLSGQMSGTCWLYLSHPAARALTRAILGDSTEHCELMMEDAARELCNVIVGNWKSKLRPPRASTLLSLPVVSYGEDLVNWKKRFYNFGGNLLALALSIRESEQNYLTTDWKSGELSSDANWLSDDE